MKHSETFHFGDDIYLLNIKDSVKQINKVINKDLKFLVQLLKASLIHLNVAKTYIVIIKRKKSNLTMI